MGVVQLMTLPSPNPVTSLDRHLSNRHYLPVSRWMEVGSDSQSWLVDDLATRIQSLLTPLGTSKLLSDQPRPLCILSKEVGALQQPTCILVANAKRCHILSTAAHSDQAGGWYAMIALSWWRCHWMAEDIWLVNALEKNINCLCRPPW